MSGETLSAEFNEPRALLVDFAGELYVSDTKNNRLRAVYRSGGSDNMLIVSTAVGDGVAGYIDGPTGMFGNGEVNAPSGIAIGDIGDIYLADTGNNVIRVFNETVNVETLSGNGSVGWVDGAPSQSRAVEYSAPVGLAIDAAGYLYVGDVGNHAIRAIAPDGTVSTLASGDASSTLAGPAGLAIGSDRLLYVADSVANKIESVDPLGTIRVVAGNGLAGFVNGQGGEGGVAEFSTPSGVAVDANGFVYVADTGNNCIRMIDPGGRVTTLAGDGTPGLVDGDAIGRAEFSGPQGVAVDLQGNVYVADSLNCVIRMISPASP